jgi:hypothetical protein
LAGCSLVSSRPIHNTAETLSWCTSVLAYIPADVGIAGTVAYATISTVTAPACILVGASNPGRCPTRTKVLIRRAVKGVRTVHLNMTGDCSERADGVATRAVETMGYTAVPANASADVYWTFQCKRTRKDSCYGGCEKKLTTGAIELIVSFDKMASFDEHMTCGVFRGKQCDAVIEGRPLPQRIRIGERSRAIVERRDQELEHPSDDLIREMQEVALGSAEFETNVREVVTRCLAQIRQLKEW